MPRLIRFQFRRASWFLLVLSLLLTAVGSLFIFEASAQESFQLFNFNTYFLTQHLVGLAVAIPLMLITIFVPARWWVKASPILFLLSLVMLVLVFVPGIGVDLNGANRWLNIGGIRLQPVEFLKFSLSAFFARWLSVHQRFAPFAFLTLVPATLLILQPDLGSLLLVVAVATILFFVAGGSIKKLIVLGVITIPLLLIAILGSSYRKQRLLTFLNPESDPLGSSFQIRQITLALGRGGWFGQGIGNSSQKYAYIPEASSDSIYAIVAEELGFVGTLAILGGFLTYITLGWRLAQQTTDAGERLLGQALVVWISLQILLNLAAIAALIPLTGIPLPFFSYGRSSQVMIFLATGYLIGLGRVYGKKH